MVQKEVAERIVSAPPRMNRLSAAVQFWAEPRIVRTVGRKEFSPPPEVDSAVILLRSRKNISEKNAAAFYKTVRVVFAQPRKTILNNLKQGMENEGVPPEKAMDALNVCGIDAEARPQDLGLASIEALALEVDKMMPGWG
jgi:16S rRNA (adenine1518-N6/adenine1519-N6)-dimethyltransferase